MAIKFNGIEVENINFNGTSLDKVIYNGTTVWENWKLKTGSLYKMTSNTTPSPFVASGTQNTAFNKYGSPWQAFDGSDSNGYGADLYDNGNYVEAIIKFNLSKSIRIKKLYYSFYCKSSGTNTRQIWLQIDGKWVSVMNVKVSGASSGTIDIGSGKYADSIVTGIRARCTSLPSRDTYIKEIKVTEWLEKGN